MAALSRARLWRSPRSRRTSSGGGGGCAADRLQTADGEAQQLGPLLGGQRRALRDESPLVEGSASQRCRRPVARQSAPADVSTSYRPSSGLVARSPEPQARRPDLEPRGALHQRRTASQARSRAAAGCRAPGSGRLSRLAVPTPSPAAAAAAQDRARAVRLKRCGHVAFTVMPRENSARGSLQRAQRHDLAPEEQRQGPVDDHPHLAVEGRHPAHVVGPVHEPGRAALAA